MYKNSDIEKEKRQSQYDGTGAFCMFKNAVL